MERNNSNTPRDIRNKRMNSFNLGDLVEIKQRYKNGYASDLSNSQGLIVEFCKDDKRVKVLYPSRDNKITSFTDFAFDVIKSGSLSL